MDDKYDSTIHRLEGTTGKEVGGLIIKKKSQAEHEFKKPELPKRSLLGLDRLAEVKRKEKEEALKMEAKKAQLTPLRSNDPEGSFQKKSSSRSSDDKKRHYRDQGDDTPSYGGGVNSAARSAIEDRYHKSRRIDHSSFQDRDRDSRNRRDDRDRDYRPNRDRDRRDRRDDRGRRREDNDRYDSRNRE